MPTPVDEATVNSVGILSSRPYSRDALISELSTEEENFQIAFDYGEAGGYLGKFTSEQHDGLEAIWTPHYWTFNSEKVLSYLKRTTEAEFSVIGTITEYVKSKEYP
jgi:hypothetical protein